MTKLFKVVGVSYNKGAWAVRYAQSLGRAGVLARNGHTKVKLYKLDDAVAKEDCVDFLLNKKFDIANKAAFKAVQAEAVKLGFLL
jgi:hypothetical protein